MEWHVDWEWHQFLQDGILSMLMWQLDQSAEHPWCDLRTRFDEWMRRSHQSQEDRSTPLEFVEQVLMSNQPQHGLRKGGVVVLSSPFSGWPGLVGEH